ncbi:hypothetical protein FPZ12_006830 [Amycolatopsis acidicola]|uniref:Uncharacterized protein n=1 Tax=Amycolatopsis acidicola TaxID=2596893 RepID=A0A5N0VIG9_9PSEU|nr:hypothetical protein [Amycolatopsis acidicola]KAA9164960.1 hypothetical protein FPZ12_006830 [Amycolatopsis acidicola]
MTSAALRYKEIVGMAGRAAEDLRAWEQSEADNLQGRIAAAATEVAAATEREHRAIKTAQHWWRMARDNVSRLTWLEVAEDPEPAMNAHPSRLDAYLTDVKPLYQELVDAVLRLGWRARR